MHPTGGPVDIAIHRRAVGVAQHPAPVGQKCQLKLIGTIGRATISRIRHVRVVVVIPRAGYADEVGARLQFQVQIGVGPEVAIVAGHQFATAIREFPIEFQNGVEKTRVFQSLGDRFRFEPAGFGQLETVHVDIGAVGRHDPLQVDDVVIAEQDIVGRPGTHQGG